MQMLKLICLTFFLWVKQACLLPQTILNALRQRKLVAVRNDHEAERLDRIRNPTMYQGR